MSELVKAVERFPTSRPRVVEIGAEGLRGDEAAALVRSSAADFAAWGVRADHAVVVCAAGGIAWVRSVLALRALGAVPVLLPLRAQPARVAQVSARCGAVAVMRHAGELEGIDGSAGTIVSRFTNDAVVFASSDYTQPLVEVSETRLMRAAAALQARMPLAPDDRVCVGADLASFPAFCLLVHALHAGASIAVTADVLPRRRDVRALSPTRLLVPSAWLDNRRLVLRRMIADLPLAGGRVLGWSLEAPRGLASLAAAAVRAPLAQAVRRRLGPRLRGYIVADEEVGEATRRTFAALGTPVTEIVTGVAFGGAFAARTVSDARLRLLEGVQGEIDASGELGVSFADAGEMPVNSGWLARLVDDGVCLGGPARDTILLRSGEPRHPARAETFLQADPVFARVVVCGEGLAAPVAIVVPQPEAVRGWARSHGLDDGDLSSLLSDAACLAWLADRADAAQQTVPHERRVRIGAAVLDDPMLHAPPSRLWRRQVQARYVGGA